MENIGTPTPSSHPQAAPLFRAPISCPPSTSSPTAPALHGDRMSSPEPQRCSSQPEKPPIISCQYLWGSLGPGISQPCSPSGRPPAPTWGVPAAPTALQNASREKSEGFGAHREVCRAAGLCAALLLQSFAMCPFACWKTA